MFVAAAAQAHAQAREPVMASAPQDVTVTIYRDPDRSEEERLEKDYPLGFAMITETRKVTIPAGRSTVRFDGVAEGMVAVSAIVTGLPGGTIEKNRNADLLSPASLVDGTLGNRVQISRMNPATGIAQTERAIVRTRADGGMVLQTATGFEAVRCAGLPEKLTFDRIPSGLSAQPVYSIDTRSEAGGTYQVTLTYISWGFDWQAHYVGTLKHSGVNGDAGLRLLSWLTVVNDNGQSFPGAQLLVVAGEINVTSDFEDLADPPVANPLRLRCYPLGNTKQGTPVPNYGARPLAAPASPMGYDESDGLIVVTGARVQRKMMDSAAPVSVISAEALAKEEQLGDLKLYRVPMRTDVAAQSMKQVAFLDKQAVRGEFLYIAQCSADDRFDDIEDVSDMEETMLNLTMKNEEEKGLGAALPMGGLTLFEPGPAGQQMVAELDMRDYAIGQDIELELGESNLVFSECARIGRKGPDENRRKWTKMRTLLSNANNAPVKVRMVLGWAGEWDVRWPRKTPRTKDGRLVIEVMVPANSEKEIDWKTRRPKGYFGDD